jgi:hypothetical protein
MFLRIFIGFDAKEEIAYHVLARSIMARATIPISITPIQRPHLRGVFTRERGPLESTDFSMSRFLVPHICDYQGYALFMDCDMLCLADVAELCDWYLDSGCWQQSVSVVQHHYTPKSDRKFLGQAQTQYPKKNWSSLMFFNNEKCRDLSAEAVNTQSGLWLHQFHWADGVGSLPLEWNWLVDEYDGLPSDPKILHYTLGGPWFKETRSCTGAQLWLNECAHLDYLRN